MMMRKPVKTKRGTVKAAGKASSTQIEAEDPVSTTTAPRGKIGLLVSLLRQTEGATIDAMMSATGWQAHSVRGAMSGSVKKALGLNILSEKTDGGRVYRIVAITAA
jgi:hypothetical protein